MGCLIWVLLVCLGDGWVSGEDVVCPFCVLHLGPQCVGMVLLPELDTLVLVCGAFLRSQVKKSTSCKPPLQNFHRWTGI